MSIQKELESFWKGDFGDEYVKRHDEERMVSARTYQFKKMLDKTEDVHSVVELGTNRGHNLGVLHNMLPQAELYGAEINDRARELCMQQTGVKSVFHGSLLDMPEDRTYDLSFTASVLIHIAPESLGDAYGKLYRLSNRYVLLCEYHNPTPVAINYRGHENRLFKRDFAGEMMDLYPDLALKDYGFFYSRDTQYGLTDINYFLMEKC
ncbi:MAG: pseudaminic acid biosynthesis-associated methylase [Pseudodesulfovibrio sp.]|nr:pseudaminic acid biosynthesis-associated methylase [Pseudodesulfovibrio sp.]